MEIAEEMPILLAPTRWKCRAGVRIVNDLLERLKLEQHPQKTFIGKVECGFDFLGYHFSRAGLTVARKTVLSFEERATRFYEHERGTPHGVTKLWVYYSTLGTVGVG